MTGRRAIAHFRYSVQTVSLNCIVKLPISSARAHAYTHTHTQSRSCAIGNHDNRIIRHALISKLEQKCPHSSHHAVLSILVQLIVRAAIQPSQRPSSLKPRKLGLDLGQIEVPQHQRRAHNYMRPKQLLTRLVAPSTDAGTPQLLNFDPNT